MRCDAKLWLGVGCAAVVAGGLALPVLGGNGGAEGGRGALAQWYGRESAVSYDAWVVARDQESLKRLWVAHHGEEGVGRAAQGWVQAPEVDFERCMVVAVFNGAQTNCNGERLVSVEEKGDHVLVRYDTITYQTSSFGDEPAPAKVNPWGMFLVARSDKDVVIEENTQNLKDHPAVWTERARIPVGGAMGGWFVPGAQQE